MKPITNPDFLIFPIYPLPYQLPYQLTTFQADQSVWHSIVLLGGDVFADDFQQVGQRHHGTAYNEIEELLFLLSTCMAESHVFQSDAVGYFRCYTYFLPEEKEKVQKIVIEEMENAYRMQVPLRADCGWGSI